MRKWNILYLCFFCLYLITAYYLEDHSKLQPIYLLVIKLGCIIALFICLAFDVKSKKDNTKLYVIATISACFLLFGYYGYRQVSTYKRNTCQDKFGREFNQRRQKLGTPEIPANWHIRSRGSRWVDWEGDTSKVGHQSKDISLDSNCTILLEYDEYKLAPVKGGARYMSITTKYAKGKGSDSVFYHFEMGDSSKLITRQQADSFFTAERISKN
jgi:hypothetical protein